MIINLKKNKSVGSDDIAAETFIRNYKWLSNVLVHIFNTMKFTGKIPKQWLNGIITFIYKNKDKYDINNYRPITITNIIYKIWATVLTNKIKPYLNFLTSEQQNAYKDGRSTIDVLYLLNNQFKNEKTNQLILLDLSKAFDTINRDLLWAILYERGLPSNLIKIIRMGHQGTKLRPKNNGIIGEKVINNKGVFQGSPLSAYLFIIYIESMMEDYNNSLKPETIQNMPNLTIRNNEEEQNWSGFLHVKKIQTKRG